ncbi:MAG: hypothetical protein Q8P72_06665 [Candidatus Roizmanbacteria bacterium]|nr:hypothetical protein [Candidatus Roizmanbacteria bacterium]
MKVILVVIAVLVIGFLGWSMMKKDAEPAMSDEKIQEESVMVEEEKEMVEENDVMMEEEEKKDESMMEGSPTGMMEK